MSLFQPFGVVEIFAHAQWTGVRDLPEVGGTRQLGCWPSAQLCFPGTTSSENLAFHGDKMGGKKITAV